MRRHLPQHLPKCLLCRSPLHGKKCQKCKECPTCKKLLRSNIDGDWRKPVLCLECTRLPGPTLCIELSEGSISDPVRKLISAFCKQKNPTVITGHLSEFPSLYPFQKVSPVAIRRNNGVPKALPRGFISQTDPIVNGGFIFGDFKEELQYYAPVKTLYVLDDLLSLPDIQGLPDLEELTLQNCHKFPNLRELSMTNPQLRKLYLICCGPIDTLPEQLETLWVENVEVPSTALAGLKKVCDLRTFRALPSLEYLLPPRYEKRNLSFEVGPVTPETASKSFAAFAMGPLVVQFLNWPDIENVRLVNKTGALLNPQATIPRPLRIDFTPFSARDHAWMALPTCRFDPAIPGLSTLVLGPDVELVTDGVPDRGALSRCSTSLNNLALMGDYGGAYSLRGLNHLKVLLAMHTQRSTTRISWSELAELRITTLVIGECVFIEKPPNSLRIPQALETLSLSIAPMVPDE